MYEAKYYKKLDNSSTQCLLCPHFCIIQVNQTGFCRARKNTNGILYAENYGQCVSLAVDPIEKKPLYHFEPGSDSVSTAPNSCNLQCPFCQNAEISQFTVPTELITPAELVDIALKKKSRSISYTYTEPLTWFEYVLDTAKIAHSKNIKNVLVTNGMLNEEPLKELMPHIDAANIDLKSMDADFYKKVLKGDLDTVLNTIRTTSQHWHIEITNLVIPGYNDKPGLISKLIDFIAELNPAIPLHFSKYFPHYKFNAPPTPASTLESVWKLAREKLYYVYVGNVYIPKTGNTYCPKCKNLLVTRSSFSAKIVGMKEGKCSKCGRKVDFIL